MLWAQNLLWLGQDVLRNEQNKFLCVLLRLCFKDLKGHDQVFSPLTLCHSWCITLVWVVRWEWKKVNFCKFWVFFSLSFFLFTIRNTTELCLGILKTLMDLASLSTQPFSPAFASLSFARPRTSRNTKLVYCNRPFSSSFEPHYESEAKCKCFAMKNSFHV